MGSRRVPKKPLPLYRASAGNQVKEQLPPALTWNLEHNLQILKQAMAESCDVVFREFAVGSRSLPAAVIFIDGLVDKQMLDRDILEALMLELALVETAGAGCLAAENVMAYLKKRAVAAGEVRESRKVEDIITFVLSGDTAFLVQGANYALIVNTRGWKMRSLEEPVNEPTIRGPKEGFSETVRVNTALLRRHVRDPRLKIEAMRLGRRSRTDCAVAFIEGVVNPDLVTEVRRRLTTIDIDFIMETGDIEQMLEDSVLSPFPQIQHTERPDKAAAALMEGRVAILVDGAPFALLAPATFSQFFQSPEDYYQRWELASFLRLLRVFASYVATFTPALYVALVSYHPGLLPTPLALSFAASREGMPLPIVVEALAMEFFFEVFREAGTRLPRAVGQTVGIVGGLIIGEAAVMARLVSPATVIVVALTAMSSFVIPAYDLAIAFRLLRFPLLIVAGILGLFGVMLGFILINIHMVALNTFGTVYLSSFVPYQPRAWKDLLVRGPVRTLRHRPEMLRPQDEIRQANRKESGW